jgi:hypothetical protein
MFALKVIWWWSLPSVVSNHKRSIRSIELIRAVTYHVDHPPLIHTLGGYIYVNLPGCKRNISPRILSRSANRGQSPAYATQRPAAENIEEEYVISLRHIPSS